LLGLAGAFCHITRGDIEHHDCAIEQCPSARHDSLQ
jgi:hypothetical protein